MLKSISLNNCFLSPSIHRPIDRSQPISHDVQFDFLTFILNMHIAFKPWCCCNVQFFLLLYISNISRALIYTLTDIKAANREDLVSINMKYNFEISRGARNVNKNNKIVSEMDGCVICNDKSRSFAQLLIVLNVQFIIKLWKMWLDLIRLARKDLELFLTKSSLWNFHFKYGLYFLVNDWVFLERLNRAWEIFVLLTLIQQFIVQMMSTLQAIKKKVYSIIWKPK